MQQQHLQVAVDKHSDHHGGMSAMDFVFMFTRRDQTVEDCLTVYDQIRPLGIRHLGFKDVGTDVGTLKELNRRIQADGGISYLEVVSTTPEACMRSARAARAIGVNRL